MGSRHEDLSHTITSIQNQASSLSSTPPLIANNPPTVPTTTLNPINLLSLTQTSLPPIFVPLMLPVPFTIPTDASLSQYPYGIFPFPTSTIPPRTSLANSSITPPPLPVMGHPQPQFSPPSPQIAHYPKIQLPSFDGSMRNAHVLKHLEERLSMYMDSQFMELVGLLKQMLTKLKQEFLKHMLDEEHCDQHIDSNP
ncbi:hypothetical protein VNO78_09550 [Psophocarpus tetragonolobus]|uniref:Uncharacterized protein n=1 Tax=Psophocarpus tetragonolobus TaxID=3891 RepID=A0AAN9SXM8_PSOTE